MRLFVIESDGSISQADVDVVIICDRGSNTPVALGRMVDNQIELLTAKDQQLFIDQVLKIVPEGKLRSMLNFDSKAIPLERAIRPSA